MVYIILNLHLKIRSQVCYKLQVALFVWQVESGAEIEKGEWPDKIKVDQL